MLEGPKLCSPGLVFGGELEDPGLDPPGLLIDGRFIAIGAGHIMTMAMDGASGLDPVILIAPGAGDRAGVGVAGLACACALTGA